MKIIKGLALSLLGFLLFLSLTTFGLAFMVNSTVLNPRFVSSEINKLDMAQVAQEAINIDTAARPNYPRPAIETAQLNSIRAIEPDVKAELGVAIDSIYAYLLGKTPDFDMAQTVRKSLLSTDFALAVVDKADIVPLLADYINEHIYYTWGITSEISDYIYKSLDKLITDNKPWLKQQVALNADPILDYLAGISQSFNVTISLNPLKANMENTLRQAFLQSPPPELAGLSQIELEQYFTQFYQNFSSQIPTTINITQKLVERYRPTSQVALNEFERVLAEIKVYVGYFQLGYKLLIAFTILLILGIILIHHEVRGATRGLGITFLTYGAFEYAGILVAKYFYNSQMPKIMSPDIPPTIQAWIAQVSNDLLSPLATLSLVLLIIGVILIVVSFIFKPQQA